MKKIVVFISGSGTNLQAIIDACESNYISNGLISLVISNNPNAYGLVRAEKFNIPTKIINNKEFKTRKDFDGEIKKILNEINPDLVVLAGFMLVLGKDLVKSFYGKIINIHPSLLPLYPGLNTHQKVIQNNDLSHGVTVHYVSEELDAGPIIIQGSIKVDDSDVIENLIDRIHKVEHLIYPKIIKEICNEEVTLINSKVHYKNKSVQRVKYYEI
tara:strand:+ start:1580 stop:2221 length:642 start_codon:yes stop_codon:yes gene_type:complete